MTEHTLFYTSINDMYIDPTTFNLLTSVEFFSKNNCHIQIIDGFKNIVYELKFESYKNLILFLHKPIHSGYILYIKGTGEFTVKLYGYSEFQYEFQYEFQKDLNHQNNINHQKDINHQNNINHQKDLSHQNNIKHHISDEESYKFSSKRTCSYICKLHDNTKSICEIYECSGN